MSENFYEVELRNALQSVMELKHIRGVGDSAPLFARLTAAYPSFGSKIDWRRVPGSVERTEEDESRQTEQFKVFFNEVVEKSKLSGDVVYAGDSATDFALSGSLEHMGAALPELLMIPQHHYFIGAASCWCISLTTEDDMGFGFQP